MIRAVSLERDGIDVDRYPFSIPAIRTLTTLELDPHVTLLAGEASRHKRVRVAGLGVADVTSRFS